MNRMDRISMISKHAGSGKKLLFVTGTRADYGKLEPLAVAAREAGFKVSFFITGMHLMSRYGETRHEVKRFQNAEFFEFVNQREGDALDFILTKTILGFSDFVHEHRPDLVVIHGDRVEALAASIVCAMRYIPSAHIEGGEVSGTIDESIRHCNSKLCTTHFVSSENARRRVMALGEPSDRIHVIGSPELDVHARPSGVDISEVKTRYEIEFEDYGIVVFHPVTSEVDTIGDQAADLFGTLSRSSKNFVIISPNNDPGTEQIFRVLNTLPRTRFQVIPSMRFNYFSELMKNARVIVGNSSAVVREAPFLGIPSLNVGTRQMNRAQANSVLHCTAGDDQNILTFLDTYWDLRVDTDGGFGSGSAAQAFSEVICTPDFWDALTRMQKIFAS